MLIVYTVNIKIIHVNDSSLNNLNKNKIQTLTLPKGNLCQL